MSWAEITALVTGIAGLLGGGFSVLKTRAEAGQVVVAAANDVVGMLNGELKRVKAELDEQRSRRHELEAEVRAHELRIARLEKWIRETTEVDPSQINGWPV